MKVVPFSEVAPAEWDMVCANSRQAWLYHRADWIALESRFFVLRNLSFALQEGSELVAVQPLFLSKCGLGTWSERLIHSGIHRHTGLAIEDSASAEVGKAARAAAMQRIFAAAQEAEADRIQLNVQNLTPESLSLDRQEIPFWVEEHGFYLGLGLGPGGMAPAPGMAACCADQIIDLAGSEDEIFARFEQRWAIRQGVRAGLTAELGEGRPAVTAYYGLAQTAAQRTGESLAPLAYYEEIWDRFSERGDCAIKFASHEGRRVAGIFLAIDKGMASYLGGVSDPSFLGMRVNDYLQWAAMQWMKRNGVGRYRLGPYFPEVPDDWPIARVSRFKKKFGGRSVTIIQGSHFRTPERYLEAGKAALTERCKRPAPAPAPVAATKAAQHGGVVKILAEAAQHGPMSIVLACYGLPDGTYGFADGDAVLARGRAVVMLASGKYAVPGIEIRPEPVRQYLYAADLRRPWWRRAAPSPAYRTLLPHVTFSGPGIEPVWVTGDGRTVVAWQRLADGRANLLIGLDIVEEIVRYRQGDPAKVDADVERGGFGFDFERPIYLYKDQIDPDFPHFPWADMLGFFVAEQIATMAGAPLLEALPGGLKGIVILTGDDDQAYLEKYAEQLACIGELPITYFLVPQTRHTAETLQALPKRVEIGVHPDALDAPQNYDELCQAQTAFVREIWSRPVRTVRNHGFLNRGYLGHLSAWERSGLIADVNCPGIDGTALNGSLLPMRVRRPDGSWSSHLSLLTAFGDGMIFGLKLSDRECLRRIRRTTALVEHGFPAALVFNLHPQNVAEARELHVEVVELARRPGWGAMSLEAFVDWFVARTQVRASRSEGSWHLNSKQPIEALVARVPGSSGWHSIPVPVLAEPGFTLPTA